jgi:hypothetical protein
MRAAFAGGSGKLHLQVHLSWAPDEGAALTIAHDQWRSNVFGPPVCWDLELTEHFDEAAKHVPPRRWPKWSTYRPISAGTPHAHG